MSKKYHKTPRVIILLLTAFKVHRDFLRGVIRFNRLHGPWEMHIIEGGKFEQMTFNPQTSEYDGLIAYATDEIYLNIIKDQKKPTIVVDPWNHYQSQLPMQDYDTILCDSEAVGRAAADYFLRQKFRNFGYVSIVQTDNNQWSKERCKGFVSHVKNAGFDCHIYENFSQEAQNWENEKKELQKWLSALPKQIALLAAMDVRGRQVIEACRSLGISVPREVAVLGVDNDELLCESTFPTMSSIKMGIEEAAFQGALLLQNRLLDKDDSPAKLIYYGPNGVVSRRSTDPSIVTNKRVIEAIEFIETNTRLPLSTNDIAHHLGISRRLLELSFKNELSCTVHEEITRIRLEKVRLLLRETDMAIAKIASETGFNNENYLSYIFRKYEQMTMSDYRKETLRSKINSNSQK